MAATALFLTPTVVKLHLRCKGIEIGCGTGFFILQESRKYIVSAWHVFSGRNPKDGQPRHKSGAVPDTVFFTTSKLTDVGIEWPWNALPLGDALNQDARWFAHPVFGQDVDVGVIPLDESFDVGHAKNLLDPTGHDPDMFLDLGSEVFLPGYPLGLGDSRFPIWKRASMATSLEWGQGVNHCFLVDSASREGMSGAPCLAVSNWRHYRMDRKTGKVKVIERPLSHRFLGVYSGRLNAHDDLGAQLGLVWRENRVFEIIKGAFPATVQLRPES